MSKKSTSVLLKPNQYGCGLNVAMLMRGVMINGCGLSLKHYLEVGAYGGGNICHGINH